MGKEPSLFHVRCCEKSLRHQLMVCEAKVIVSSARNPAGKVLLYRVLKGGWLKRGPRVGPREP